MEKLVLVAPMPLAAAPLNGPGQRACERVRRSVFVQGLWENPASCFE